MAGVEATMLHAAVAAYHQWQAADSTLSLLDMLPAGHQHSKSFSYSKHLYMHLQQQQERRPLRPCCV